MAEILGSIIAPGGNINLNAGETSRLWLGAAGRLNVSGTTVTDNRELLFNSGKVLPGGKVTITATLPTAQSVIGLKGALINVSGATGRFDLPSRHRAGPARPAICSATDLWSDAGSISITAPTLLYDGAFVAQAGSPQGNGGSLTWIVPGDQRRAATKRSPSSKAAMRCRRPLKSHRSQLTSTNPLVPALAGSAVFFADRLSGSGIQTLTLSMGRTTGDAFGSTAQFAPGKLVFSPHTGNVSLSGVNQLFLDASQISLVDPNATTTTIRGVTTITSPAPLATDPRGCNVCIDAGYVTWRGAGGITKFAPKAGKSVLLVSAGAIDIAAGGGVTDAQGSKPAAAFVTISGAAQSSFVSTGDIRLRVPLASVPLDLGPGGLPTGGLVTAGDLTLKAAQIYPVSSVDFTLKSSSLTGTIRFAANGAAPAAPLSAGGQVSVSAANIEQLGVLRAPLGTIRLGAQTAADLSPNDSSDNILVPTKSVIFGAGSETSVSLAGEIVPFGQTANGASWSYNSSSGSALSALPSKNLVVTANAIQVGAGATVDLTGGGDVQAIEFVPGTGGARDVLSGSNVYAIIPGYDPAAAPIDLDFLVQRHAKPLPAAGARVFLSGAPGLPAGFYTLLPAHYATLPGALRVSVSPVSAAAP